MSKRFHIVGDQLRGRPSILEEESVLRLTRALLQVPPGETKDVAGAISKLEVGQVCDTGIAGIGFVIRLADDTALFDRFDTLFDA